MLLLVTLFIRIFTKIGGNKCSVWQRASGSHWTRVFDDWWKHFWKHILHLLPLPLLVLADYEYIIDWNWEL